MEMQDIRRPGTERAVDWVGIQERNRNFEIKLQSINHEDNTYKPILRIQHGDLQCADRPTEAD
jgi:hypothetical protein